MLSLCFLTQCSKDNDNTVTNTDKSATVSTKGAEVQGKTVMLKGSLSEHKNVTDHGFFISTTPSISTSESNKRSLGKPNASGDFSKTFDEQFSSNIKYYYCAYIKINDNYKVGYIKDFELQREGVPVIRSIYPPKGKLGDTIIIRGTNFTSYRPDVYVSVGGIRSTIVSTSYDSISCMIPRDLKTSEFLVSIQIKDAQSPVSTNYQLGTPEISSIYPTDAIWLDTITIKGSYFDNKSRSNDVWIDDVKAEIVSYSHDSLEIIIPINMEITNPDITIKAQNQEIITPNAFTIPEPELIIDQSSVYTGDTLMIRGNYFHPSFHYSQIYFENNSKSPTLGSTKTIRKVIVPEGPYTRKKAKISIQHGQNIIESEYDLDIMNTWVCVFNERAVQYNGSGSFTYNNYGYIISRSGQILDDQQYISKFDHENYEWDRIIIPDSLQGIKRIQQLGDKIYAYYAKDSLNFYEYQPQNNSWRRLSSFPGSIRVTASTFALNGQVYFGGGFNNQAYNTKYYKDFYRYNPANDQWDSIPDIPALYRRWYRGSTFVLNNKAYLFGGGHSSGDYDMYSFDPTTDTWTKMNDLPYPVKDNVSFSLNGKGYFANGKDHIRDSNQIWEYDPDSDTWTLKGIVGLRSLWRGFVFKANGTVFIGGSQAGDKLYELIPERF